MTDLSGNLKILIAEDNFEARQALATALRMHRSPYIDTAVDGKIARDMILQAYKQGMPYDIVFLDWDMPLLTGIEILKHFREQKEFSSTAFVMVTSMSIKTQVLDAIKSGATAYMIKPVTEVLISKRFNEIVDWLNHQKIG